MVWFPLKIEDAEQETKTHGALVLFVDLESGDILGQRCHVVRGGRQGTYLEVSPPTYLSSFWTL